MIRSVLGGLVFGFSAPAWTDADRATEGPLEVAVVEIGESRQSTVGSFSNRRRVQGALAVRIEVSSSVDFTGRLETVLRSTDSPTWQPVDARNAAWLDVELDLAAHQKATFDLLYHPRRLLGQYRSIDWRVRGPDGSVASNGTTQTVQSDPNDEALRWALYLTDVAGAGRRRSPSDAFQAAFKYAPYRTVVIASPDFVELDDTRRRALLDATAFGRALVVCGGTAGFAESIREILASEDSVVWRGDDGSELREVPLVFGVVRTYSGTVDGLIGLPLTVRKLVDFGGTIEPIQSTYNTFPVVLWKYILSLQGESEDTRSAQAISLSILGVALIAVGVTWVSARKHPPPPRAVLVGLVVTVCIAAPVGHLLLAENPVGNVSLDGSTCWHDRGGTAQIRQVFTERGGGGGTAPTEVRYSRSTRALWFPMSLGTRWRTVVSNPDRGRIESIGLSNAGAQCLSLLSLRSEPPAPAWIGSAAWDFGELIGRLRAGRDFESAVLVGFGGTAPLGAVRAGQELDLSEIDFRYGHDHLSPADLSMIADGWQTRTMRGPFDPALSRTHRTRALTQSEFFVFARDASPRQPVHVQPVRLTSVADAPPYWLTTWVPSTDLGSKYRLFVPDRVFDSWRPGTEVDAASISFTVNEDLETSSWNGFRVIDVELKYRTAGDRDLPVFRLSWCGGNWS
jgi:hypothetical protein